MIKTIKDLLDALKKCPPEYEVALYANGEKFDVTLLGFNKADGEDINSVYGLGEGDDPLLAIGPPPQIVHVDYEDDEDDKAWAEEQAMEIGMGMGIDAYNDARGCSTSEPEWDSQDDDW